MNSKEFLTLELKYDSFFDGYFADKPIYKDGVESCLCITHDKVNVCNVYNANKPNRIKNQNITFHKLDDRNIFISLDIFEKDDDDAPDDNPRGDWGYQLVLIDKDNRYVLEYQDHFITGDARGGSDFQVLTSDWQY